jgi:hypothetical protein
MAIIQALGRKALEKTSSTLSNFAKGAFQAGMAEAPGIAYGYSALKGLSGKFSSSTTSSMGGSTSTTSNGVTAKESRSLIAVNMLMLREMKQTNLGIQKLNRMIGVQTAIALRSNMFAEERNRESQLFNERLLNALKGLSIGGTGGTTTKNSGGGLLSGIADGIGTLLQILGAAGAGALGLKYGAPVLYKNLAKSFRPSTRSLPSTSRSLPSTPSNRLPSSGTQLLGRNGQVIRSLPNSSVSSAASGTPKMPAGAGALSRLFGGLGLLLYPSSVGAATLDEYYKNMRNQTDPGFVPSSPGDTNYLAKVIQAESGGRSNAQASTSSAFGLGQFVKGTFQSLAANAPKDSVLYGKSFEDYKKSEELQIAALKALTDQNRSRLVKSGLPTDDASLYLAHFLGAGAALKVLQSNNSTDLRSVLPASYFTANPAVFGNLKTVGDLKAWAARKMSGPVGKKAAAAASMAGGGGRGLPPVGSQSAATDPGEIPGVTTRSLASVLQPAGGGTKIDKFIQTIPVYDKKADENSKKLLGQTTKTAEATTSSNVANFGKVRPTKVTKTPYEVANEKFINSFGKVTERVYKRELDQFAQKIFGKDYARGMTAAQGARSGVVGRSAGKILGIDKAATKLFGRDYGPVFAQLGKDYMEEGLRSVGEILFTGQVGDDARGLTGAILGNYAQGNKKAAKEQLIYGLLGVPTGPQSLTMFLGGPNSPFPSLKGVKNPKDLVNKIAMNAAQGTQDMLFGGPPGSGQGGGILGGIFGRGAGAGTGSGTTDAVDTFNAWETYSNESLVQQQNQTGLLESIFGANTQGNSIFGAVGSGIMKSLGAVGSGILKGIQWLGGSLGNLIGGLFKGLGSLFGGGGGNNTFSNLLNMGSNVLDFGKALFNVGPITDFGASYLTNLSSTALNVAGLAGTATSYAALVPGLTSTVAGSQAAMLASQTAVFGAEGLAATAAAAQGATVAGAAGASTAAVGSTAAAGSGFMSSLAAAAPYIAVAAVVFSLLKGKKRTPALERGIITLGNNDITQKFDVSNIRMRPNDKLYQAVAPLLDSLLNVVFTAVKNIQAKTKTEPPMFAIGMHYGDKDKRLLMKLYTPSEALGGATKWEKYYGTLTDSFDGAKVAAEMVRDIQAYYSEGKDESAITAITEATNEVMGTSFQQLSAGTFSGLSTLDQTAPVSEQTAELARTIRTFFVNRPEEVNIDDSNEQLFYNPLTGKYERAIHSDFGQAGQIGYDEQGRAIIDVNKNRVMDIEDIERSQARQEKSVIETFMNNYNSSSENSINYQEAVRLSLSAMWQEANYDPYTD